LALQVPLVTVHFNTAVLPAGTPVTVDVFDVGLVMLAVPLKIVQSPVPGLGLFPANVNDPLLHWAWLLPALEVTGASLVKDTFEFALHVPLVTVHFNTAVLPAGTPVTVDVFDVGLVMLAVPLTIVQSPVPGLGLFAANVNDPLLH
jgi:phosphohistidine swiveling domain-containing protein